MFWIIAFINGGIPVMDVIYTVPVLFITAWWNKANDPLKKNGKKFLMPTTLWN